MDSVIAKLIQSRTKSIKVLEAEVVKLDELASQSRVPAAQASLISVAQVKRQRLVKLKEELAGLVEAGRQQEVLPLDPVVNKGKR